MEAARIAPALVAHGGAGGRGPASERPERRRGMLAAVAAGADILRAGGSALDAVVAVVRVLEDHPLFNAGVGSLLTTDGTVEMDASLMAALPPPQPRHGAAAAARDIADLAGEAGRGGVARGRRPRTLLRAGAVAGITRVRNPILLARAVMELTPHIMMAGAGAERLARRARIPRCRPEELITQRARERWRAAMERRAEGTGIAATLGGGPGPFGTVGAVALDARGGLAAATSTGGVSGKLSGRVGDSAIIGAGTFADDAGAASATGQGEAIMQAMLCREVVVALTRGAPHAVAERAIAELAMLTAGQAGVILVDRRGKFGYAHNAEVMDVATFDAAGGFDYRWVRPLGRRNRGAGASRD
ncbi:MAG TPA: isoaspartyl peptidase/L-asparaginase [Candidatus Binataceae bacterium]